MGLGKVPLPDNLFRVVRNRYNYPYYHKKTMETLDEVKEATAGKVGKKKRLRNIYIMDKEKWYSQATKRELEIDLNLDGETEEERRDMHRIIQCKIR